MKVTVKLLMGEYDLEAAMTGVDPDGTFVYTVTLPVALVVEEIRKIDIDVLPAHSRLVVAGTEVAS